MISSWWRKVWNLHRPTPSEAALIGYFMGDGWCSATKSGVTAGLCGNYTGDEEFVRWLLKKFKITEPNIRPTKGESWAYHIPKPLTDHLRWLGVELPCDADTKKLPFGVIIWPRKSKNYALSGLWQSDGGISIINGRAALTYTTNSGELAADVARLLRYRRIYHTLYQAKRGEWVVYVHKRSHKRLTKILRLHGEKREKARRISCRPLWIECLLRIVR